MQNRVLIYSKPNIGYGPPPPELRTNSTFMFCIATAQRKYNRPTEEKCQWWITMCCHGESQDAQERERESIRIEGAMCQRHFFQMFP